MNDLETGIKNLVERAIIVSDGQEAVTEYFISKQQDRTIKKYPEWDKPRVCPALEVVRAEQELRRSEEILQKEWKERDEKRKLMDQQWEDVRRHQLLLRESFIKFNKFVKENQEKRERAELKIKDEQEHRKKLEEEVEELTRKIGRMKAVRDKMQEFVGEYRKYQDYLERVVSETGEFQSINEIFNRYETLLAAKQALAEHQDRSLQALEDTDSEIHHMTEAKAQVLMGLNNKLAQLHGRENKAKALALKWETAVSRIKAIVAAKDLELTQVKSCCWNIYQQICKKKGIVPKVARDDFEQQLIEIKRNVHELKRILKVAKRYMIKEEKAHVSN